jgi:hypothetical protein
MAKPSPAEPTLAVQHEPDQIQEDTDPDEIQGPSPDTQARILAREQERQDREAAMAEYVEQQKAELRKTARLRAARLAREKAAKSKTKKK